jgi:hypothetical protein
MHPLTIVSVNALPLKAYISNPSYILTKYLGWAKFWPLIQPLLFWKGETLLRDNNGKTTIPLIIKVINSKLEDPVSGLKGVTGDNHCDAYTPTDRIQKRTVQYSR